MGTVKGIKGAPNGSDKSVADFILP